MQLYKLNGYNKMYLYNNLNIFLILTKYYFDQVDIFNDTSGYL